MASKTLKMRQREEEIKKAIVRSHQAGKCDKDGSAVPRTPCGCGHLPMGLVPFGIQKIRTWPRDDDGNLVGDD
jgi:hypothetical protein